MHKKNNSYMICRTTGGVRSAAACALCLDVGRE